MSKQLTNILYKVRLQAVFGSTDISISSLCLDSREVRPGSCFIAIAGTATDGHQYITMAVENGAVAVVCQQIPEQIDEGVTYIQALNTSEAAAWMSHHFYDEPSSALKLVGVTGTNGKTTIVTLLYKLFTQLGYTCGLVSTVQNQVGDQVLPSTHTTPDAVRLNALLKQMLDAGCSHVFMECSSHAIQQHRITGLEFAGGLFSNITHDHLDYHKTFEEYIRVKKKFFDNLQEDAFAISNLDDKRGPVMLQNTKAHKYYYSLRDMAEFKGKIIENGLLGLVMDINGLEVHFRLIGEFNAYNILAVYGAAVCLDEDKATVLRELSALTGAEGRFDYMISPQNRIMGVVDYAHTPDALLNVLVTLKKLLQGHERIITVVGCGGDRDKTKRPLMAEVACEHSDKAILTSDNPRSEDPQQIIDDMMAGMLSQHKRKSLCITDRREAIKAAVDMAQPEDILLVAGKGHEKYQEVKGVKQHFDDKEELINMFRLFNK